MYDRGFGVDDRCTFGCRARETDHHIFIVCPRYKRFRSEAKAKLVETCQSDKWTGANARKELRSLAEILFVDNDRWPAGQSQYFLGHIPVIKMKSLQEDFRREPVDPGNNATTTAQKIHSELHIAAIRLAGRIYGDYARNTAKEKDTREKRTQ
jgi:hypothetical protein